MTPVPKPDSIPPTPCIGRTLELEAIRSHFDLAMQGQGLFCIISGEAGSGKSTLLRAFTLALNNSEFAVVIAWGRCDRQIGKLSPLAPWSQILQSFSGVPDFAIDAEKLQDSNSVVQSLSGTLMELAPEIIELLVPGFGLAVKSAKMFKRNTLLGRLSSRYTRPDEKAVDADRFRLQDQYISIIEGVLVKTPLVIVIDDLDCADEASLQLLSRIAEKTAGSNILFLVAARSHQSASGAQETITQIGTALETLTLDLDQIREDRGKQFVAEYTSAVVPGVDAGFVQDLARHTGGHPLFVVELVGHLSKLGHITLSQDHWQVSPQLDWKSLPRKIETILADQLQDLDAELLDILQAGSTEGDRFSIEVVAAALEKSPISVARALTRRAPKNLIVPLDSEPLGASRMTRFRFSHSLARQYIYDAVDPIERVYLHLAVATQLETLAAEQADTIAAQLAYQFEQAQVNDKALRYYEIAAARATATCSLLEAIAHLQRALALCGGRADQLRVKYQLAKLQMMIGENQLGAQLFAEASLIAEEDNAAELATILADHAIALARINNLDAAAQVASHAEKLASKQNNDFGRLSALQTLALIHNKNGRNQEALEAQYLAMPLADGLGVDDMVAESLSRLGAYLKELGRYEEARNALQQSLDIQQRGQPNYAELASTRNALADMYINLENYPEAREQLLLAIEHWRQFDRHADVAVGLTSLANLANREGLFEEALQFGRQAYDEDIAALGSDHPDLAFSLTCIGESLLGLRNFPAAIEALSSAYAIRRDKGARRGNLAWSSWLLGRALAESGSNVSRGRRYIKASRSVLASMGAATLSEVSEIDAWLAQNPT